MSNPSQRTYGDLFFGGAAPKREIDWLWQGYLAARRFTLFTAQWKSGKTTLLSLLLARLQTGGTLAGLPVHAVSALVVSEEPADIWQPRIERLGLEKVCFNCQPFNTKPTFEEWVHYLDYLEDLCQEHHIGLLAFDTLGTLLPEGCENHADATMRALLPLQRFARAGLGVLLVHHPRKAASGPGLAARGSGAFAGFVDIILEMHLCPRGSDSDRRRRLHAFSRLPDAARETILELNDDATDYKNLGAILPDDYLDSWQAVRRVLEDAQTKLTCVEILQEWPQDFSKPCQKTLSNWLLRAVNSDLVNVEGTGHRRDPYRYWLPYMEETWRAQNPAAYEMAEIVNAPTRHFYDEREKELAGKRAEVVAGGEVKG